ncbi:MAG: DUF2752 domain-containing protein [Streptosporangiales bacterium]|nr:DUF2752 domain-containing protein [Streptosporangiales bacterium]
MTASAYESHRTRSARVSLRLRWEQVDRHRRLVYVALGGLVLGGAMAVFGLPPIDMHGPLHRFFGIMDPLCGGTRGVRYAMRGEWGLAWAYNPVSIPLVVGAIALVARHAVGKLSGRWLNVRLALPRWVLILLIVLPLVVLEINQQLHAALLMGP